MLPQNFFGSQELRYERLIKVTDLKRRSWTTSTASTWPGIRPSRRYPRAASEKIDGRKLLVYAKRLGNRSLQSVWLSRSGSDCCPMRPTACRRYTPSCLLDQESGRKGE